MRTLIINLTRLGDLLQMQGLIRNLHAQGATVDILCLEHFKEAAKLLHDIHTVHNLPAAKILALEHNNWHKALSFIEKFAKDLQGELPYQRIINMTASQSAGLLSLCLATKDTQIDGYALDNKGKKKASNLWLSLFEAAGECREGSPYNIADVFAKGVSAFAPATSHKIKAPRLRHIEDMRQKVLLSLPQEKRALCQGFVGIQLGASAAMRQWPAKSFAHLAQKLWDEHALIPILFGTKKEEKLADDFLESGVFACNFVGKTSLLELATLLCLTKILLTNDTGTMHLATALDVPVLAFFLATAQVWDTGPLSEKSCILEAKIPCQPCAYSHKCQENFACAHYIKAKNVWPLLDSWLKEKDWQSNKKLNDCARVWQSTIDECGFRSVRSLSNEKVDDRSLWLFTQSQLYRQFFDKIEELDKEEDKFYPTIKAYQAETHFSKSWQEDVSVHLKEARKHCQSILEKFQKNMQIQELLTQKERLQSQERVYKILQNHKALCMLAHIWKELWAKQDDKFTRKIALFLKLLEACEESIVYKRQNGIKNA